MCLRDCQSECVCKNERVSARACARMRVCACVRAWVRACVYFRWSKCARVCACVRVHVHVYMFVCARARAHLFVCVCACACVRLCVGVRVCAFVLNGWKLFRRWNPPSPRLPPPPCPTGPVVHARALSGRSVGAGPGPGEGPLKGSLLVWTCFAVPVLVGELACTVGAGPQSCFHAASLRQ